MTTHEECEVFVDYLISVILSKVPRFLPVAAVPAQERRNIANRLACVIENAIERKVND